MILLVLISRAFNVFKKGNVTEAERSLSVIESVKLKVSEFLKEWPEHPILNEVHIITTPPYCKHLDINFLVSTYTYCTVLK